MIAAASDGHGREGAAIDAPPVDDAESGHLLRLVVIAAIAGVVTGIVGGAFRVVLEWLAVRGDAVLVWARAEGPLAWLLPIAVAFVFVAVARLLVVVVPTSSGSGIQLVEANMRGQGDPPTWRVVPAKFIGGALAIGAGLALGREGPTVQMGAAIGSEAGRLARVTDRDRMTLSAALAGAGLAVAFSAPFGGAVFVLEEIARAFRTRLAIATLVGVGTAIAMSRLILGPLPVFPIPAASLAALTDQPMWWLVVFAVLGVVLGLLGPAYNRFVLFFLAFFDGSSSSRVSRLICRLPVWARAGIVGALVGIVGLIDPSLVGGGESLNESILVGRFALAGLVVVFLVRWVLGPLSYGIGTAGGLFAPLIVVGAVTGSLFATTVNAVVPAAHLSPLVFAIVGMSTFFASTVRAPITGVLLVVEMTATTAVVLPMVVAAGMAMLTATLLKAAPVYDSLRRRMLERP